MDITKINELIHSTAELYDQAEDEGCSKLDYVKMLKELSTMATEEEKLSNNYSLTRLEKEKLEFQKQLEFQKNDLEKNKLEFEKEKLEFQKESLQKTNSLSKLTLGVSICGIVIPAVVTIISKFVYARLTTNAQLHDYNDYIMESSFSKENRNHLITK